MKTKQETDTKISTGIPFIVCSKLIWSLSFVYYMGLLHERAFESKP